MFFHFGVCIRFFYQWISTENNCWPPRFRDRLIFMLGIRVHIKPVFIHYNDVIMGAIASQITILTIVNSTVYSDVDQRKHQSSASLACAGNSPGTVEFPAHIASNAENVSIWWRHRDRALAMKRNHLPLHSCLKKVIKLLANLTWLYWYESRGLVW